MGDLDQKIERREAPGWYKGLSYAQWPAFLKERGTECLSAAETLAARQGTTRQWEMHVDRCSAKVQQPYEAIIYQQDHYAFDHDGVEQYEFCDGEFLYCLSVIDVTTGDRDFRSAKYIFQSLTDKLKDVYFSYGEDLGMGFFYGIYKAERDISKEELEGVLQFPKLKDIADVERDCHEHDS